MRESKLLSTLAIITAFVLTACNTDAYFNSHDDALINGDLSTTEIVGELVPLNSASSFAVLAATTVTNADSSIIIGDLGVSPGTAITGFEPEPFNTIMGNGTVTAGPGIVIGTIYAGGPVAAEAQADAAISYDFLLAQESSVTLGDVYQLDGQTFSPGVYQFPSSANLQVDGTLTLDFQGNSNAQFIFQLGSTLVTMTDSNIIAINNGDDDCIGSNVWWAVGSSATIDGDSFIGNLIAFTSITMTNSGNESGTNQVAGRLIALNGSITMIKSMIAICGEYPVTPNEPICNEHEETAWSDGNRYVSRGNWATYTAYDGIDKTVTLLAGQTQDIGTVNFSTVVNGLVTMTINLNEYGSFQQTKNNVKIEGYNKAPNRNPAPGRFSFKGNAEGSTYQVTVPAYNFYGVHVDANSKHCD